MSILSIFKCSKKLGTQLCLQVKMEIELLSLIDFAAFSYQGSSFPDLKMELHTVP